MKYHTVTKNDNVVLTYLYGKILWCIEWKKESSMHNRGKDAHRKTEKREELYRNAATFHDVNIIYHWTAE